MQKLRINFVPKELQPQTFAFNKKMAVYLLPIAVLSVVGFSFHLKQQLKEKDLTYQEIVAANNDIEEKIKIGLESKSDLAGAKEGIARKLLEEKVLWAELFKELSMIVPDGVWLTDFSSSMVDGKRVMTILGQSASNIKTAVFFQSLEKSYFFRDAHIQFSEKLDQFEPDLYRFQFDFNVATVAKGKADAKL